MNRHFILFLLMLGLGSLMGQNGQQYWTKLAPNSLQQFERQNPFPKAYQAYQLDFTQLKAYLSQAPQEWNAQQNSLQVALPGPSGRMMTFDIVETEVMPDPLQAVYPGIKTFLGKSSNESGTFIRLDYTYLGFHAKIRTPEYTYWIEPVALHELNIYITYLNEDAVHFQPGMYPNCGTLADISETESRATQSGARNGTGDELLIYRVAFAADERFTDLHGGKTGSASAIVSTVNFTNDILELEVAIRLTLIPNNNTIIFDATDDPYSTNDPPLSAGTFIGNLANENQTVLTQRIGSANFDLGQVFTVPVTAPGGFTAGIAIPSAVCRNNVKANSVTGALSPVNTGFFGTFAHEIGHQFGALHTFHSNSGICTGQRSSGSAYEPAGATTLMGYATCEINSGRDNYYHARSYEEMFNFSRLSTGNNCATIIQTNNQPPTVDAGEGGWTIPIETPFILEGSGADADGDPITFCWEQSDRNPSPTPLNNPSGNAPIFRSFPPTSDSFRIFPRINDVLSGSTNPLEQLPTYARDLNFRLTVRDNNPAGGGRAYAQIGGEVTDQAGPFVVTKPNSTTPALSPGQIIDVEWDVANTDQLPVNCQTVDIYLSTDGGLTFDILLAEAVPNTGNFEVCAPNAPGASSRIMVRAHDNIFFNVSPSNFTIQTTNQQGFSFVTPVSKINLCQDGSTDIPFESCPIGSVNEKFTISGLGLPPGVSLVTTPDSVLPGEPFTVSIQASAVTPVGNYNFTVNGSTTSGASFLELFSLEVFPSFTSVPSPTAASNVSNTALNPNLSWTSIPGATGYVYELASDPDFNNIISSGNTESTAVSIPTSLDGLTTYYWRVAATVECGVGPFSPINAFRTGSCNRVESNDIPKTIDAFGNLPIEAVSTLDYSGPIPTDVNVFLEGTHDNVKDLSASIVSPGNIELSLFSDICENGDRDFNLFFDSEAQESDISCPPLSSTPVQPNQSLSFYYARSATGTWTLKIKDFQAVNGGELTRWGIEFCQPVNSDLEIINNDLLYPPVGSTRTIFPAMLRAESSNTSEADITYTLVSTPSVGSLAVNGNNLLAGDTFTQADIENNQLTYTSNGTFVALDNFKFIVEDPNGGWVGVEEFQIGLISNLQPLSEFQLSARPNPTQDFLLINLDGVQSKKASVRLIDMQGRTLEAVNLPLSNGEGKTRLDMSNFAIGMYLLEVEVNGSKQFKKILKN